MRITGAVFKTSDLEGIVEMLVSTILTEGPFDPHRRSTSPCLSFGDPIPVVSINLSTGRQTTDEGTVACEVNLVKSGGVN